MRRTGATRAVLLPIAMMGALGAAGAAQALTMDQAREACRPKVTAQMQSCMQGLGGGDREANRAKCRNSPAIYAAVKSCMMAALNASNGRANVAIAIPNAKKDAAPIGNALPAGFVAPPRTIADIAAILDAEKPDPAVIAKLKQQADANAGKQGGAQFYYDRGVARSLLGRYTDAVADGEKAVSLGRSSSDEMFVHRIQTFVAQQKQLAGDMKWGRSQPISRSSAKPGRRKWWHGKSRPISNCCFTCRPAMSARPTTS